MELNKGELAYVPASVTLYQFAGKNYASSLMDVRKYCITTEPANVLVIEGTEQASMQHYHKVLYRGEVWFAPAASLYLATES
tara:strand:- start:1085 stop:1330 length:246 start_codon:yes stop_codon:yes gene_type:complete